MSAPKAFLTVPDNVTQSWCPTNIKSFSSIKLKLSF